MTNLNIFALVSGWFLAVTAIAALFFLSKYQQKKYHEMRGQLTRQITEAIKRAEKAEELSITDELTGLPNRRYFNLRIKEAIARAVRYKKPMCLLIIDVDDFKKINDKHGLPGGDVALKEISSILRENLRKSDALARYGGDEFFAAVLECENGNTEINAQRIIDIVKKHEYKGIQLSVSIGVGTLMPGENFEEIYKKTDKALKEAKKTGKGKLVRV